MLLPLFFAASLTAGIAQSPSSLSSQAQEAQAVCRQYVQVRVGSDHQPDEIRARPLAKRVGEWVVDGKIKGPEGPLLFACHLAQGTSWTLLNFSLWASPSPTQV